MMAGMICAEACSQQRFKLLSPESFLFFFFFGLAPQIHADSKNE